MTLNLDSLARLDNFDIALPPVGFVRSGTFNVRIVTSVSTFLQQVRTGHELARFLLEAIGTCILPGTDNTSKSSAISAERAAAVGGTLLEEFAGRFLLHHRYLADGFGKNASTANKVVQSDDENLFSFTSLPRQPGETNTDYLLRAIKNYESVQKEHFKRILEPISRIDSLLSSKSNGLLQANAKLSASLDRLLWKNSSTSAIPGESLKAERLTLPSIPPNPVLESNRKLGELLQHFGEIREIVQQAGGLISSMNSTALAMQADAIENAAVSSATAKASQRTANYALGVAVASLIASVAIAYVQLRDSDVESKRFSEAIERLEKISAQQLEANGKLGSKLLEQQAMANESNRALLVDAKKTSQKPRRASASKATVQPGTK